MGESVYIIGSIIGAVVLLSICFVYVKHQVLNIGGMIFAVIGMILMGMPVWSSINVSIDEDGFEAQLQQAITVAEEARQQAAEAKQLTEKTIDASLALKESVETFKVQQKLKAGNYYTGDVDGNKNPTTVSAIKKFQHSKGLPVTGSIDRKTSTALGVKPIKNFPALK